MTRLAEILTRARKSLTYKVERAVLEYTSELEKKMDAEEVSRAELARRIDSSAAYVTQVLRGTANPTIKTMVALADAVGGRVEIRIVDEAIAQVDSGWRTVATIAAHRPRMQLVGALQEVIEPTNEPQWKTLQAA